MIGGSEAVHRAGMHHAQLEIGEFEYGINPLFHGHRSGLDDLVPINGILQLLERGGMIVGIGHCEGEDIAIRVAS